MKNPVEIVGFGRDGAFFMSVGWVARIFEETKLEVL